MSVRLPPCPAEPQLPLQGRLRLAFRPGKLAGRVWLSLFLTTTTVVQAATDFGDYSSFPSASSTVNSTLKIGSTTDGEASATTNATATGDDTTGSDDEDGVTVPASIVSGTTGSLTVNVTNTRGSTSYLNAWIDFNRNGVLTDSGEQIATNTAISNGTSNSNRTVSFTVPAGASIGAAGVRVRLTSTSSPGADGLDGSGEVEDHLTTIVCPTITLNPVTLSSGTVGFDYSGTVTASGGTSPLAYTVSSGSLPNGLTLNGSTGGIGGTPTTVGTSAFTIRATDSRGCTGTRAYSVQIYNSCSLGSLVWQDTNNNGIKDSGEIGINDLTLVLLRDSNGDGDFVDAGESNFATTTTNGSGQFQFTGLPVGQYRVTLPEPPSTTPWASRDVDLEDNQQDNDSNGYQHPTGGPVISPTLDLGLGESDQTIDFGLVPPACQDERMVLYMTDLNIDIVHKFKATGSTGIEVPGAWGGTPWLRQETSDSTNGITNPHGVWFNGYDIYIGGQRGGNAGTFRYNQQGQRLSTTTNLYRLTHTTVGNYIYYPRDSFISVHSLSTGAELGRVNLSNASANTWGISVGKDGFLYIGDNYQSSTFPNGNSVRGSGKIYRVDPKPSTFTSPATLTYSPIITGLNDLTGIDTDASGNLYVVEVSLFGSPPVTNASKVLKYSPQSTLLATYNETVIGDQRGVEDAWGLRWNPVDDKLYIATRYGDCVARLRADTLAYDGAFIPYVPGAYGKTLSLQIECATLDMGDLPDTGSGTGALNYETAQENGGPTHIINTNLRIGSAIDGEHAANPNNTATGDDTDDRDDEDGISNMPVFVVGQTAVIPIYCYNKTGTNATLSAFFDWNMNGSLNDSGEKVTLAVSNNTNGIINLNVPVPSTAQTNLNLGARFRLATASSLGSTGIASDGEVEDYIINVVRPTDFGDFSGFGSASSLVNASLRLGATTDYESVPATNATATGDDTTGSDDEDGVTVPASIVTGTTGSLTVNVTNTQGSTAYLNAWIDFNRNGVLTDSGEQIATNTAISNGTSNSNRTISFTVPASASIGDAGVRVRLTSTSNPGSTGERGNGEVEDYVMTIATLTKDFGDYDQFPSASSTVNSRLKIGALSDAELAAATNGSASGDDLAGSDDEDGVTLPAKLTQGAGASMTVNVTNTSGSSAYLNAWIDFNRNGTLTDSGEQVATNTVISNSTSNSNRSINFTVPAGASLGTAGVRVRLTSTSSPGSDGLDGTGEVEDHTVPIAVPALAIGNLVWQDLNNNGLKDVNEPGVDDVPVELLTPGADNAIGGIGVNGDTVIASTTTAAGGIYGFTSLAPGRYYVRLMPPASLPLSSAVVVTSDNGVDNDNNGSQLSFAAGGAIVSPVVLLATGSEPGSGGLTDTDQTIDFGLSNGNSVIWLIDEDKTLSTALRLWSFSNYRTPATTATDYGRLKYLRPSDGAVRDIVDAGDIEAMAINRNTGEAYILSSGRITGAPSNTQSLWTYNLNDAPGNIGNIVLTLIGHIQMPTSGAFMEALAYDPDTKRFFTADPRDDAQNSSTTTDRLYCFDIRSLNANPMLATAMTLVGDVTGQGQVCRYADGLEFSEDGRLFIVDGTDDHLYQISPTTGAILIVSDSNIAGGPGGTVDVETMAWDEISDRMVAVDNSGQRFIDVTLGSSGSNIAIASYRTGVPGMPSSADLEASAMYDTYPPQARVGVGNAVFIDTNNNGRMDAGEGVDGVTVDLYVAGDVPGADAPTGITTTANGGRYFFGRLLPDNYYIHIPASNFAPGAPLHGHLSLAGVSAGDDNLGEDGIDAPAPAVSGISSAVFSLADNEEPTNATTETGTNKTSDDTDDNNNDLTIDFGFRPLPVEDFGDHASLAAASSTANNNLRLGAAVDAEYVATTNASATGDDSTGIDDEDGVTVPANMEPGATITLPVSVTNTSGTNAYLHAWIDFNNNGTLNNATIANGGERIEVARVIPPQSTGTILREYWTGIGGTAVSDLTSNAAYPNNPTSYDYRADFTAPVDWADNMGQRMRGWIYPPVSGEYTFWVSGDDETHLYLSTDETAANAVLVASVPSWTGSMEWAKYSQQKSVKITLVAGQPYYIEGIMKEGGGGDSLATAWELPGTSTGPVVIAGQYLAPWTASGTPFNGNQQITFTVPQTASTGANRAVRFRLTNSLSTLPTGASGTGEVEDYAVTVVCPVIAITPTSLPGGKVGQTYSATLSATPSASYAWSLVGGTLPAGLSLNASSGVLAGTPTLAGESSFTVRATSGGTAMQELEFTTYNLDLNPGDTFNLRDYVIVKGSPTTPIDWSKITFTYTDAGANDPPSPANWNLANFNAGNAVTVTAADAAAGGNSGTGSFRIYLVRNGQADYDDHAEIRIDAGRTSAVNSAKASPVPAVVPVCTGTRAYTLTIVPPTDYGDFSNFDSASSTVDNRIRLGALVDAEGTASVNTTAMGDDTTGVDDEDGIVFPSMTAGQPVTLPVTVTNSSGTAAYLNAWIDFNNNGLLTDPGEQIAANIVIANGASNATQNVSFTVPTDAITAATNLGARLRITSTSNPGPTGESGLGEVEDHAVVILAPLTDFGDFSGAADVSNTASSNLRLGTLVDTEYASTRNAAATGDDITGNDDEDGVTLPSMIAGAPATLPVIVTNTSGRSGYLNAWIDYNNNGSFTDIGEQIALNALVSNGTTNGTTNLNITVPPTAVTGTNLGARFRITSDISPGAFGAGGVGEVEDYIINIAAPTTDYGDYALFGGASSTRNNGLRLGASVDTEYAPTTNSTATGDDTIGIDDEDGVTLPAMIAGGPATIPVVVTNSTGASAYLNAWIDYNGNGIITDTGEQIATNVLVASGAANSTVNLNIIVPPTTLTGVNLGVRVRLTSTTAPDPVGASGAGEVEDYIVNITAPTTDFGDFVGFADASQGVSPSLRMGTTIDAEYDSTRDATATGDDLTGTDDEDGVALPSMIAGQTVTIPVTVTNATGALGYLNAWIDFNNNGLLTDSGEQVATNVNVITGTSDGVINLTVNVPTTALTGTNLGARFRLSAPTSPGSTGANAAVGEIEDYVVNIAAPTTDFGDFSRFGSASSTTSTALRLGALVDAEYNATTNTAATGDNLTGLNDEDGVTLPSMTAGQTLTTAVAVTNTNGATAFLNAWIDFNNNGLLTDAGEQIALNRTVANGTNNGSISLTFTVPPTAVTGTPVGVRLRLTSTSTPGSTGFSGTGEVEDYAVTLVAPTTDFGDWSGAPGASNGVSANLRLGALTDAEYTATTNAAASGDDSTGVDDEDGVTLPSMTAGAPVMIPVTITNNSGAPAYLNAWIDFNNNGSFTDTGEQIAINTAIATGTNNGAFNINAIVPATAVTGVNLGARFRLTSTASPGATGSGGGAGEVEDYVVNIAAPTTDFGDFSRFGSASSIASTNLRVGALVDTEFAATSDLLANGDDSTGMDDEDGVTLPAMTAGAPATIPVTVTNNSGAAAFLNIWIDFNNNGALTDAGEQIITNLSIANGTSNAVQNLNITIPVDAVTETNLGVRVRLTSVASPTPVGAAGTGEVEDYIANIARPLLDYGDWSALADAASTATSNLRMGAVVDTEYNATRNIGATGDDSTGVDDEDGVVLGSMTAGAPASISVATTNLTGAAAFLNVWIDYNNNGALNDAGEQITANLPIANGTNNAVQTLSFTVPASAITGASIGLRFRLTSVASPGITGIAGEGEVEDYVTTIAVPVTDFGDWSGVGDASSLASSDLRMGSLADTEYVSTRNADASGDDSVGSDDEDGVTFGPMTPGASGSAAVVITNNSGSAGYLNAWIDFNNNNSFADAGEQIATNILIATGTNGVTQTLNYAVPAGAIPGGRGARFRLTSTQNPTPLGASGTGEVEDHLAVISCLPVMLSPSTFSNAAIGTAYSQTLSSSGGMAPYVYSVSSGSLPPGLSLNPSSGVLSGTPTSSGSFNFNLTTTDAYGCAGTLTYALRVCAVITVNPASLTDSTAGSSYTQALTGGGGTGPYVFAVASGALPNGLSLNTETGVISGTPTSIATMVFTLRATDANGCTGTRNYVVTPACPQITVTPASLPSAEVNTPYSQTVAATNGSGPYTFAVSSGALPAGLSLNTSTGVLSGSITSAATASFTIRATASDGCVGSTSYSITPSCPTIALAPASLPTASLGYPYSETLTASGSAAPYTYMLQSGALPSGLVLAANGILNGAPSATGTFVFTILVTDASGCTHSFPYTLLVGRLTLGNQIFEDSNNNGSKDVGEPGIAGALVQLFTPGSDDAIGGSGAAADSQIGSDLLTNSSGQYVFTGLSDGNYYVKVTPPGSFFATSGTPATTDNNIDNNNDGSQPGGPGTPSFSPIINLAASAESTTDGDTNPDTNLTLDFGFWSSVAVGNYVFLDVNGDGVLNPGERLQDVLIYLYAQGDTPGTSQPVSVALSDSKGRYYMDQLNPGNYFLHVPAAQFAAGMPLEGLLPMATVVAGDDDAGQDLIFNNNPAVNGASTGVFALRPGLTPVGSVESGADGGTDDVEDSRIDLTRDLGFVAPSGSGFAAGSSAKRDLMAEPAADAPAAANTFALWRQTDAVGAADDDPDADGTANLFEYALGTDPLSGIASNRFNLTQDSSGGIEARLTLPLSSRDDIVIRLETLTDLTQAANTSAWQPLSMAAATSFNADGTLTRRYADVERLLVFAGKNTGFLRLKVELDADRNGTPEASATSAIHAWSRQTFPAGTRSFSMPLLGPAVFTGRVLAVTGQELTLPVALTLPAGSHYLEILDGPLAGQRREIDAALSAGKTLTLSEATAPSTGLGGARIAIRTHWTLSDLLPPAIFSANDRLLFFNTSANDFTTFTLHEDTWTSGALSMNARPFLPVEAALVTARDADRVLIFTGEVRADSSTIPLAAGTQLIGSGWPAATPVPLVGLRSGNTPTTADRLRLWNGDTDPAASSYTSYFLDSSTTPPSWQPQETPDSSFVIPPLSFSPFHGIFLIRETPALLQQTTPW